MMEWIRFALTAAFVLAGLVVCAIGVYGIFRFDYAVNRMHAAAVVDTMGISLCMVGFAISAPDLFSAMKIVLVIVFWWLSSPVASHMLARLEITTNEKRGENMNIHEMTLAQERLSRASEAEIEAEIKAELADEPEKQDGEEEQA